MTRKELIRFMDSIMFLEKRLHKSLDVVMYLFSNAITVSIYDTYFEITYDDGDRFIYKFENRALTELFDILKDYIVIITRDQKEGLRDKKFKFQNECWGITETIEVEGLGYCKLLPGGKLEVVGYVGDVILEYNYSPRTNLKTLLRIAKEYSNRHSADMCSISKEVHTKNILSDYYLFLEIYRTLRNNIIYSKYRDDIKFILDDLRGADGFDKLREVILKDITYIINYKLIDISLFEKCEKLLSGPGLYINSFGGLDDMSILTRSMSIPVAASGLIIMIGNSTLTTESCNELHMRDNSIANVNNVTFAKISGQSVLKSDEIRDLTAFDSAVISTGEVSELGMLYGDALLITDNNCSAYVTRVGNSRYLIKNNVRL